MPILHSLGCHFGSCAYNGTLLGTPNREPQEYSRIITEYKARTLVGIFLVSCNYILGFPCFGVPIKTLLV